jgi:hypothetical protein
MHHAGVLKKNIVIFLNVEKKSEKITKKLKKFLSGTVKNIK